MRVLFLALCVLAAAGPACERERPRASGRSAGVLPAVETRPAAEEVGTSRVERGSIQSSIAASGSVVARRSTDISAGVPGRLLRVSVDLGDVVEEGAPLFEIDPEPYQIALEEAEAGLQLFRAEHAQARLELKRARQLTRKAMMAEQSYEQMRTRVAITRARVQQAEARVRRARHDLTRTIERAPYAGSIVERRRHEGAKVSANAPVLVLQETGALEAALDVPETAAPHPRAGDPVHVHVEGVPGPIQSTIRAVSDRIDAASRTYTVRVPIDDPSGQLKAGAFARGEILPRVEQKALVLDRSALIRREGRHFVFRIEAGVARRIAVEVGAEARDRVEILSGLSEGDLVVVEARAVRRLADGTRVVPLRVGGEADREAHTADRQSRTADREAHTADRQARTADRQARTAEWRDRGVGSATP